ncbi:MAG: 16S rRNA (cytosine(1402)-N(4))-methyltransferase RsmH [Lachnospiraceae bacterium]|nr:16S rRNA (cytosine(1402)-N(4))-methyltransferase RsmH [Lachnospiraceae bacterium]
MTDTAGFKHYSVMLDETIESLKIRPDGIYVDGTLGGGGHSSEIVKRLDKGRLIGIDQDEDAIQAASKRLSPYAKVTVIKDNYEHMALRLKELGIESVDGILLDLGVSSYQLDTPGRGFSYMAEDALLDMRMDKDNPMSAADIVNTYSEADLIRILREYGEEKFAAPIAKRIVKAREGEKIVRVGQLNSIIDSAYPAKERRKSGHTAKKTYQALRIELNRELTVLSDHIEEMIDLLSPSGRLCIITFHSLEDRIVKNAFKKCENPCTCPPNFPVCVCGNRSKGKVITKKPITPCEKELNENSRSRSAKLRVFEKGR